QVLLGDQLQLVVGEAGVERQHHRDRLAAGRSAERLLPAVGGLQRGAGFLEDGGDAAARAFAVRGQQRALAGLAERLEVRRGGFIDVVPARALGGEVARRAEPEVDRLTALRL